MALFSPCLTRTTGERTLQLEPGRDPSKYGVGGMRGGLFPVAVQAKNSRNLREGRTWANRQETGFESSL